MGSCRTAARPLDKAHQTCEARADITLNLRLKKALEYIALAPGEECATEQIWGCPQGGPQERTCSWHESPITLTLNLGLKMVF
jgi:hypothetical protein